MVLKHYIWLFTVAIFAIWQSTQITYWSDSIRTIIISMPYIVVALGVFITLWLNRIQPLLILLCIGAVNLILLYFVPSSEANLMGSVLFPALSVLLPLNLVIWIWLPEKGVYNKAYDGFVVTLLLLQAALIYWLVTELPFQWVEYISAPIMPDTPYLNLPFAGGLMFLIAGFFLSIKLKGKSFKVLYHAVIFVLILMAYGLNLVFEQGVLAWISTFAAIIIILSVVFDSHHIAYTDELTGLYGRRALMEAFLGLGRKYVLAMVDIDHFKKFNDSYGHDVGDDVLRRVATVLNSVSGGKAYRYGGEEFTLLFTGKTVEEVMPELEHLRAAVAAEELEFKCDGKLVQTKVTISVGVAVSGKEFKTAMDVLKYADEGLYVAKEAGRNMVVESGTNPKKEPAKAVKRKPAVKKVAKTAAKRTTKTTAKKKPVPKG
ncbi:MAG: hypothetical protein ISEC1_P1017 [Thiomicrorhabdus sp.]|nr:MAG: hypothetical protein ISEC1_P1017 [Thiomicrorhabdus sp.]